MKSERAHCPPATRSATLQRNRRVETWPGVAVASPLSLKVSLPSNFKFNIVNICMNHNAVTTLSTGIERDEDEDLISAAVCPKPRGVEFCTLWPGEENV